MGRRIRKAYNFKGLLWMNWWREVSPLVDFLNLEPHSGRITKAVVGRGGQPSVTDFMSLGNEMEFVLDSLNAMETPDDAERVAAFLASRLTGAQVDVEVMSLRSKRVEPVVVGDGIIPNIWADFVCIFLQRGWTRLLGRCPRCGRWFARSKVCTGRYYCDTDACEAARANSRGR